MPDNSGTHLKVTAAAVWAVQEAALEGPASPIEAYSSDLNVLDAVQDSQQVTCMALEVWHQAQQADPTLCLVISRLWDGTLEWWVQIEQSTQIQSVPTRMKPSFTQTGHPVQMSQTQGIRGDPLSVGVTSCTESGCSEGMPWSSWSSRLGTHAWSHVLPVLLASHGCSGKGTCWKVLPVPCL